MSDFQFKPPSQRQLRVAEVVRHALSSIFMQGEFLDERLQGVSITVSEVRISPDLRHATVYIAPLGKRADKLFMDALHDATPLLRKLLSSKVRLRYLPKLVFKPDDSFVKAATIDDLLQDHDNK